MNAFDPVRFDPPVELPPAEGRLATDIARRRWRRIECIEHDGQRLWIKRAWRTPRYVWRRNLRDRLAAKPWPGMRWLPRVEWGSEPLVREVRRLVCLRHAGFAVPEVVAASSYWMVLADCGESMRAVLKKLGERNRRWLLAGMAADLANLHAAGFWHGGAQVKNTTLHHGKRLRIDFDTGFDPGLSLTDLQARDVFFFLLSAVDWVPPQALADLVRVYLEQGGQDAVVGTARAEMLPLARKRAFRVLPGNDMRRVRGAAAVLEIC